MSDEKKELLSKVVKAVTPIKDVVRLPAKEIGTTLADIFYLALGDKPLQAQKRRLEHAVELERFEKELREKIENIPENHRIEPSERLALTAVKESQYSVSEPEIRRMFSNLIASSMDDRLESSVHPAFVDTINQLSVLDARNLQLIKNLRAPLPTVRCVANFSDKGFRVLGTHLSLLNPEIADRQSISVSLSCLERLGLLSVTYSDYLMGEGVYEPFETLEAVKKWRELFEVDSAYKSVENMKGLALLTEYAKKFVLICL